MSKPLRAHIYDPNTLNPYGIELAQILRVGCGREVVLWTSRQDAPQLLPALVVRPALAISRRESGLLRHLFKRLAGPVRAAFTSRHGILIVVWSRDWWDASVLLLRCTLVGRCIVVYHNPRSVRPRRGVVGLVERLILRKAVCAVHSEWLAAAAREENFEVVVVEHPPYDVISRPPLRECPSRVTSSDRDLIAWIGGVREDKGFDALPEVARASGGAWTLCYLGTDPIPVEMQESLAAADVLILAPALEGRLADIDLVSWLRDCAVALAPYREVTESGSIRLSMAVGVGVLGSTSNGLDRVLNERSRFGTATEMGIALREFLDVPWETFCLTSDDVRQESIRSWLRVLNNA